MCQETTELLWIGFLTDLILILKFKFDTLTPNTNLQTYWQRYFHKWRMEPSSSFVQRQPFQLHLLRQEFQLELPKTMAKRMQEQKGEERIVAKSRRTAMNLSSHVPTSSSSVKSLIASKSPEILTATVELASRMTRNSKSDAASSSQVRLQAAHLGGLMDQATVKLVATEEESGDVDLSESENESEGDVTGNFFVFFFFFF